MNDPNLVRDATLGRMAQAELRPIDTSKLGPITTLPDAADELAKAIDAIQAAEGALCRARKAHPGKGDDAIRAVIDVELSNLRSSRHHILAARGGPKAEPVHVVGGTSRA